VSTTDTTKLDQLRQAWRDAHVTPLWETTAHRVADTTPRAYHWRWQVLRPLIDRAIEANIPVVIAVAKHRFADWIKFADGMSVKLGCDRHALDAWWHGVSARTPSPISPGNETICEILK